MNISLKQLFLMAIISSFYTATMLPTKYRDQKYARERYKLALKGLAKTTTHKQKNSTIKRTPIIKDFSRKMYNASYVTFDYTFEPALFDAPIMLPDGIKRIRKLTECFSPSKSN